ncbi:hypothetical protein E2493_12230 [Sphingomonas parva]|uniref:Uncharacterized protein n=1 Tax=Sphingomonas parva TaxID=2555898 RepID=A0A4Y8ZPM7_9SPHN|nr:hypothetical protein [Sphingomonas parva]TFI57958.1 hypothetical protein E2493_12230 [Sphingomonas parva]
MASRPHAFMFQNGAPGRVELVLTTADGHPWAVTMSAGTERFIGRYPRLNRLLVVDGPLLDYRAAYPGL